MKFDHKTYKEQVLHQIEDSIQKLIPNTEKFNEFMSAWKDLKGIKFAQKISDYIGYTNNRDDLVKGNTFTTDSGKYEIGDSRLLPTMKHHIQTTWGNGDCNPICSLVNQNKPGKDAQTEVHTKRLNLLYDKKARAEFERWLATADKSDPRYLCRKYILNPSTLEGVHTPWIDPKVKVSIHVYNCSGDPEELDYHHKRWLLDSQKNIKSLRSKPWVQFETIKETDIFTARFKKPSTTPVSLPASSPMPTANPSADGLPTTSSTLPTSSYSPAPYVKRILWQSAA